MDEDKKIVEVNIEEEMKKSYLDYAMSVIVSRALPDVRGQSFISETKTAVYSWSDSF